MKFHLLLGAGFTKNWGGWLAKEVFEYLLGSPEVIADDTLRKSLWAAQLNGKGFEDALAFLENSVERFTAGYDDPTIRLHGAIRAMFANMNAALEGVRWEFQPDRSRSITDFLARFDTIFTLNQDTLLEHHYWKQVKTSAGLRWRDLEMPGMRRVPLAESGDVSSFAKANWIPFSSDRFEFSNGVQHLVKLHGSSNWFREEGSPMLVIGGAKEREISQTPLLAWYAVEFARRLKEYPSKLMIIGYGFGDEHINRVIRDAVQAGLKLFVIAPEGSDVVHCNNVTRQRQNIIVEKIDERMILEGLIGASRRSLSEIFGGDLAEHSKVMRFFSN